MLVFNNTFWHLWHRVSSKIFSPSVNSVISTLYFHILLSHTVIELIEKNMTKYEYDLSLFKLTHVLDNYENVFSEKSINIHKERLEVLT